ncbi:MAG: hypothetical protein ACLFSY_04220 [Desulfonatronovibrionaceae bacterium]
MPEFNDVPEKMFFILSTGRTGTHFFEKYINSTCERHICLHEPKPSRRFKILSNLYIQGKISDQFVFYRYLQARKRYFKGNKGCSFVESNNFMFGCIPAISKYLNNVNVIHIVRHPVSYIISHLNHGFWRGRKKVIAKYMPYWLEDIGRKDDPVRILARRWGYVNERINSYNPLLRYMCIRFEDLFDRDEQGALSAINSVRRFLGCPELSDSLNYKFIKKPTNVSRGKQGLTDLHPRDIDYVNTQLGPLMKKFGYWN